MDCIGIGIDMYISSVLVLSCIVVGFCDVEWNVG
jgi:hypothetical protein